jgi:hypothetical protein
MQYDEFVERVAEKAGITRDEAERASVLEQLDPEYADFLA